VVAEVQREVSIVAAEETDPVCGSKCPLSREPQRIFSAKMGTGGHYIAGFTIARALRSACHGSTWLFASQGRGKDCCYEFLIIGYRPCLFVAGVCPSAGWHAIAYSALSFGRAAGSLLFCRTAGTRYYG